jgi:hypothetical protein
MDNGIGNVAVNGTMAVTPSATTVYTLTANNAAGNTTASTQAVVVDISGRRDSRDDGRRN